MKKLLAGLVVLLMVSGCATTGYPPSKAQQGALLGTGLGAATGAALGAAIGGSGESALLGAAAGAVVGGIAGGMIGSYMDRQEQELRQALANVEQASIQREQNILAVTFRSDMLFDFDSAVLKPGAYDEIDRVATVLRNYPQTRIRIEGHTDSIGSEQYNQMLSERRAMAVRDALVQRGVDPRRIEVVGYGESKPIATNATEAGRQLNRRVTIVIIPVEA
ncbi:OmpA family protein [Thermodesulforhabdus norvegica]|uniref:Outer membrane protein OmpA n=1 Tax=Thermodesulforhabdus norvegica TaxID=39841 RepID=A0A1I4V5S8_9BACT|nr:OmpA family protein [Thermodesulforhabdus norvegica]SFM96518.1 Outer membrane protein OmpA [Thermodesulforhabdus norvegica]